LTPEERERIHLQEKSHHQRSASPSPVKTTAACSQTHRQHAHSQNAGFLGMMFDAFVLNAR
jgi:hypothetical protein